MIIGLSQITLITDILIALQSFKIQCQNTLNSPSDKSISQDACLQLERQATFKTRVSHAVITVVTIGLLAEILVRWLVETNYYYDFIFPTELVIVAVILTV